MIFSYFSDKGFTEIAIIQQTALLICLSESKNCKHSGRPTVSAPFSKQRKQALIK